MPRSEAARIAGNSSVPGADITIRFAVLVFPGFPMMAFSSVIEPLRAANLLAAKQRYSWITVSLQAEKIFASNGACGAIYMSSTAHCIAVEIDPDLWQRSLDLAQ